MKYLPLLAILAALLLTPSRSPAAELWAMSVSAGLAAVVLAVRAPSPRGWAAAALLAAPAGIGLLQIALERTEDAASTEVRVARWCAAGAFALAISTFQRREVALALDALGAAGGLLAGAAVAGTAAGWPSLFANRNHLAAFCFLLLPVAIWRWRSAGGWWRGAASALLAVGGLTAGSRAGLVLTVGALLLVATGRSPRTILGASPRRMLLAGGVALVAVAAVAVSLGTPDHWSRRPWLLYRDRIWASGWELFVDKPLLGHGLGSFATVYPAHATFDTGETVHRAHNDWLEWLVEGGVLAPVPMAVLGAWMTLRARQRPWLWGVPLLMAHSLVDYPLDRFVLLLLLAALAGMACTQSPPMKAPAEHRRARKKLSPTPVTELERFSEPAIQ